MKLPGRTEGAVQELVGVDPGVYAQRGQAVAQLGGAVSAIATDWEERTGNARAREALVEMSNNLTEFRTRYGNQRTFTAKEIETMGGNVPDEQRYREWTDDAGNVQREEKSEFDAEDFYPAALKHKWEAEAQLQAKNIPGSQRRAEFLARQQDMINGAIEQEVSRAQIIREQKLNTRFEVDIQNAEISGNYEVARMLISQHPTLTPEEKDAEQLRLFQAEEQRQLAQLRMNEQAPDASLRGQIARLQNPIYGGDAEGDRMNSLTIKQREQEVSALKSVLKAREADRKAATNQNFAAFHNEFYDLVDDPETTRAEALAAIDRGLQIGVLKQADVTRMRKYINDVKGGGGVERRETEAQLKFIEMDDLPIDVLQGMDYNGQLDKLAGVVTPAQLKHLKAKSSAGIESHKADWKENVDYMEAQLGFQLPAKADDKQKKTHAQQQAASRRLLYDQFQRFEREQGRPPDANERQEITDRLVMSQTREKRLVRFGGDQRYKTKEVSLSDVPYQRWDTITRVLEMAGEAPGGMTAMDFHAVNNLIDQLDKVGIDNPTPTQIDEARQIVESARAPGTELRRWAHAQKRLEVIE